MGAVDASHDFRAQDKIGDLMPTHGQKWRPCSEFSSHNPTQWIARRSVVQDRRFDVFISYPHQDKSTADAVCAALEADGVRCWIAPRDVAPGAEWASSIVTAINRCRVMVLIFSSSANQSKQIHREVQQAFDKEKPVVPFRIEDVAPEDSLSYYMGPVHWLDALTPPLEKHLLRLVESVHGFLRTWHSRRVGPGSRGSGCGPG